MRGRSLQVILMGSHSNVVRSRVALQVRRGAAIPVGAVTTVTGSARVDNTIDVQTLVHEVSIRVNDCGMALGAIRILRVRRCRRQTVTTAAGRRRIARCQPDGIVVGRVQLVAIRVTTLVRR